MYEKLLDDFVNWVTSDDVIQKYWDKVNAGTASYSDAIKYSEKIGAKWSDLMKEIDLSDDESFSDIAESLRKSYRESAYYSKNVQQIVNQKAGIGLKVKEPSIDDDRISNLIEKLSENLEDTWLLDKSVVENIARSAVTDTIEYNARFQQNAGLYSYIERDGSNCCDWCRSMTGRYIYGEQPRDFFQVHKDCTCVITYRPSKRPVQKIRYESGRKITT